MTKGWFSVVAGSLSAIVVGAVVSVEVHSSAFQARGPAATPAGSPEWPTYSHDGSAMRFSPLTELTPANVSQLKVAWTYHMRPAPAAQAAAGRGRGRGGPGFVTSQVMPVVVGGTMYLTTPYGRVVALDATTGKELWVYQLPTSNPSTRGVEYWAGDARTPAQVLFHSNDGKLYSVNAKTGVPNPAFAANGILDTNTPEIRQGTAGTNSFSSPPTIFKNLIITGSRAPENPPRGPAGDVRAWDIHTGSLVWTFRSVPRAGEPFVETWGPNGWQNRTGVNVWGLITVDAARGIAYLPFGAPSVDQYGGDRPGDNLFSTSLVAVDANTGKYLWHFQLVRHDIWDADISSAPVLMDVRQGGRTIPAVAAIGKTALLYIVDRVTGKPIYGVEDRPVPQSEVPLERSARTQPFPLKPAPLARTTMTMADIATVTPELEAACRKLAEGVQLGGPFMPPGYKRLSVRFPGNHGGVNWGGMAYDPSLGFLFIATSDLGQLNGMTDRPADMTGPSQPIGTGNRLDPDGPYVGVPGGGRFSVAGSTYQQLPCQQPPWGTLTAVNVHTGEFAWRVPLGVTDSLPEGKQNTGRPLNGGPIATAGGLVFIAATDDERFRAFDAKNGKEVWTVKLSAAGHTVPSTYRGADGKQYVALAVTGGGFFGAPTADDSIVVYSR